MKLVIEITEGMYQAVKDGMWCGSEPWYKALKNGKPLPKGHGRLIDAKEFESYIRDGFRDFKGQFKTEEHRNLAELVTESFLQDIAEQKTVVPEDKEEGE